MTGILGSESRGAVAQRVDTHTAGIVPGRLPVERLAAKLADVAPPFDAHEALGASEYEQDHATRAGVRSPAVNGLFSRQVEATG